MPHHPDIQRRNMFRNKLLEWDELQGPDPPLKPGCLTVTHKTVHTARETMEGTEIVRGQERTFRQRGAQTSASGRLCPSA